jgi:GWxTD domain-containing protein
MRKRRVFILVIIFFASLFAEGQTKVKPRDLAPQYQEWLKLTTYIIKDKELDVFLSLTNDRDRDRFIEAFWKIRDPTPETPENEFKQEHIKRFQEASKRFRRRSAREGWMTDQGRIWIILGKPSSTEDIAGSNDIYPCEIWSYYGDVNKGMPTHFSLVFFQWRGAGEYKLYDPLSDGPAKLLVASLEMDIGDNEAFFKKLYDCNPDLAMVALSIIPGEVPGNYIASPENAILMGYILDSPKKSINESYATHFLDFKGIVSTEYLTNYMESAVYVAVVRDPVTGTAFCDFAMSPARLSVSLYEPTNQYSAGFLIDVSVRAGEKVIYQYSKDYPLTIPGDRIGDAENMGVCIADSFPLVEGKYKLTVLLRNTTGKEFSSFEREVEVPAVTGRTRLGGFVLGYKFGDVQPGLHVPYQTETKKVNIDPKNTYSAADEITFYFNILGLTDDVWKTGSVGIAIKGSRSQNPFQKSLTVPLSAYPFHRISNITQSLLASGFPPDYYDMTFTLRDGQGTVLDERTTNFIVSPQASVAHPMIVVKASSLANSFIFYYIQAHQYDEVGEEGKAEEMYKTALSLNPAYLQKVPEYAEFLIKIKKFEEAVALVERIKSDTNQAFQYHGLKGRALMGLDRNSDALASLQEANKIYNSDTGLLDALGLCYFRLGETRNALNALNASLKLNPDQPEIKKLIKEVEAKK